MEEEDLGELPPEEKTAYQFDRFHKNFQDEKVINTAKLQIMSNLNKQYHQLLTMILNYKYSLNEVSFN